MALKIKGTAEEAAHWIRNSSFEEAEQAALLRFVSRFPTLTFFKKERSETDPTWLREMGRTCMGVVSENVVWYQFEHFDHSEYDDYRFQDDFYNVQGFAKDLGEYAEIELEGEPLRIAAAIVEHLRSVLAVKGGDGGDPVVYDFSYEDIQPLGDGRGKIARSAVRPAFPSCAEMFGRISAVKFSEEEIIEAAE